MGFRQIFNGADTFSDTAGTFLSNHAPNVGIGTWVDIGDIATNRLIIPVGGRIQPDSTNAALAAAHLEIADDFSGHDRALPRYVMSAQIDLPATAQLSRFLLGVYSPLTNSIVAAGWMSLSAALESGDVANIGAAPLIVDALHGGEFDSFAVRNPFGGFRKLAGGSAGHVVRDAISTIKVCVDEYQIIAVFDDSTQSIYYAYPSLLRQLRPDNSGAFVTPDIPLWHPYIALRSNDIASTGIRCEDMTWKAYALTPQEIFPQWEPVEGLFVARVTLDYQTRLDELTVETSNGPYLVYPPTRYRDVEVHAQMVVVDNSTNPAYLDVSIASLEYEVLPFSRLQLVLPVFSTPILVAGGGTRGAMYLYSEVVVHI